MGWTIAIFYAICAVFVFFILAPEIYREWKRRHGPLSILMTDQEIAHSLMAQRAWEIVHPDITLASAALLAQSSLRISSLGEPLDRIYRCPICTFNLRMTPEGLKSLSTSSKDLPQ